MSSSAEKVFGVSYYKGVTAFFVTCLILYFGRSIFIPLSFAVLISFVLYPVCAWLERKGLSRWLAIFVGLMLLIVLIGGIVLLLFTQLVDFLTEWPALKTKLSDSVHQASQSMITNLNISQEVQEQWLNKITEHVFENLLELLQAALSASAVSSVLLILIPVYTVLILNFRAHWVHVLQKCFPKEKPDEIRNLLMLSIDTYYKFIKGMVLVYLMVGVLNSVGLFLMGVPHALFFGFTASILTFIPYIGIMIGSLLPMSVSWVMYNSIWYPLGVAAIFTFVQYLEANVIFPFAVSARLNVNTLVTLIVIFVGGILWGVSGMILFVPFVGILKLIADHHPRWKTLGLILGGDSRPKKKKKK
jgi:predicted PurR-regulated permease PerM